MKTKYLANKLKINFLEIFLLQIFPTMASQILFYGPDDKKQFKVKDHIADICNSHTIIYDNKHLSVFRILDKIDSIDCDKNRIRVNYTTGSYLILVP